MLSEGRSVVPADGMGAIPDQLAKRAEVAGATIETDATVSSIDASSEKAILTVDGETVVADAVVVATDSQTARDLTGVSSIGVLVSGSEPRRPGTRRDRTGSVRTVRPATRVPFGPPLAC